MPGNGHGGCGGRSGETGWSQGQHRAPDRPYYLNGYVPTLQTSGQVWWFFTKHLGFPIASPAIMEKIGTRFRRSVSRFAEDNHIPMVRFGKDDRKLDVM